MSKGLKQLFKLVIVIILVVIGVKKFNELANPDITNIEYLLLADEQKIEEELGIELQANEEMQRKIYRYTNGELTVNGTADNDFGVIYVDEERVGVHIDDMHYSMFGLKIGDMMTKVDERITFKYNDMFQVLNDMYSGSSTAEFYYNSKTNECLVVVENDFSARIVAMTYYSDASAALGDLKSVK